MKLSEFIKVYPNFKDCSIQLFDDNASRKDKNLARIFPAEGIDWKKVKELNDKGAGVFFSVNSMKKSEWLEKDGKKYLHHYRDKDGVTHLNTWIVEADGLSKEKQLELITNSPIKPSCVIESEKSFHIYFFAKDATFEKREVINRGLREYFYGDKSICSDTARVFRLPDANHNKGKPYKITCQYCEDIKYLEADMLKAFPYNGESKLPQKTFTRPITKYSTLMEYMASQSSIFMLKRVSGSNLVKGEDISFSDNTNGTKQIFVNSKSTGARLDSKDYIGSAKGGGPTWIQRCQYMGNSKEKIYDWFIEFCDDLIPEKFNRTVQLKEREKIIESEKDISKEPLRHIEYADKILRGLDELMGTNPNDVIKFGREERDSYLGGIYGGKIYLVGADSGTGKTTMINQIINNISETGVRVTRYSLEDRLEDNAKEEIFYTTNRIRFSKGKELLNRVDFVNGEYTSDDGSKKDNDVYNDIIKAAGILSEKTIIDLDKVREVGIEDMVKLMNEECDKGTKVFVIDHLHYFAFDGQDRMDLQIEKAMKDINEIARKRNVAVFLVAHYNGLGGGNATPVPTMGAFKGSSSIKQIANVIIQITRDDDNGTTEFHFTKMRGPIKKKVIEAKFDHQTYSYNFTKTTEQIKKEEKKKISLSKK